MDKVSQYSYDELQPHQEQKLFLACLVEDIEGFIITLDGDAQLATIEFNG